MVHHEVRYPDRTDLTLGEQLLQRPVSSPGPVEAIRSWLMKDQQVNGVEAEFSRGLVECMPGLVVTVVAGPHLRP